MEELFKIKSRFGEFPDYRITKSGVVWSCKWGKLRPLATDSYHSDGYSQVYLMDKNGKQRTIKTHTIVADTFIPNPKPFIYTEINHKDEDKTNNCVDNLEWCTKGYNNMYKDKAKKIGLKNRDSNPRKRKVAQFELDGTFVAVYKSVREAARVVLNDAKCDSNIHSGIRTHQSRYGYYWRFVDDKENCDNLINRDNQQPSLDLKGQERFRDYKLKLFKIRIK